MSDKEKIADGEMAIRLTHDISGGLGVHEKGTVLRNLSLSAFTTLKAAHEVVEPGSLTSKAVDATDASVTTTTVAPPAPVGKAK